MFYVLPVPGGPYKIMDIAFLDSKASLTETSTFTTISSIPIRLLKPSNFYVSNRLSACGKCLSLGNPSGRLVAFCNELFLFKSLSSDN